MCLGFNRGLTKLARNHDQIEEDVGRFRFDSKKFEDGSISSSRINRWVDFRVTPLVPFGTIRNPSICSVNIPSASLSYAACYFTFSCNLLIKHYPAIYSHLPIHPIVSCFSTRPHRRSFYETVGLLRCVSFHSNPLYSLTDFRSYSLTRVSTAFQH